MINLKKHFGIKKKPRLLKDKWGKNYTLYVSSKCTSCGKMFSYPEDKKYTKCLKCKFKEYNKDGKK